ncbi:hypothetical protein [Microbacterium capsulatum]|uniref:Uncharacterized protein n=1 Tax=Microbacterium capsulatum TaxID=3041921 RepID=A0ABU0XGF6_9MICO|nr:hypothetical protein [Microbacterium sp. ASV81]MDQ4213754.1 hypothetical protein [Microbacterium sp. ASV81]
MNSSTTTTIPAPDETERARQLIELGLAVDPEARSQTLARLIAASLHQGPDTALGRFASTGQLDQQACLDELNQLRVPFEQEAWIDAFGRFVLFSAGGRS